MAQQQQQPQQQVQPSYQQSQSNVTPRHQQQSGGRAGRGQTSRYGSAGMGQGGQGSIGQGGQQRGGIGQQRGGTQMAGGQTSTAGMPIHFEDALTSEMRQALEEFSKVDKTCEWAVEQTLGKGMPNVVRVLRDIADLAEVNEKLLVRSSTVGPHAAEAFVKAATDGIVDLQQYSDPHIVETVTAITRAIDSTQKLLTSIGWTGSQQAGGQQFGGQQGGGQQFGGQQGGGQQFGGQQGGGGQQFGSQTPSYY